MNANRRVMMLPLSLACLPPLLCFVAPDAEEVKSGFERSTAEAMSSFGDDRMLVEKYIEDGHHIEIQASTKNMMDAPKLCTCEKSF